MMTAIGDLSLVVAILSGFMRSATGWCQAGLFRAYAGLPVDGSLAVMEELDMLGNILRLFVHRPCGSFSLELLPPGQGQRYCSKG